MNFDGNFQRVGGANTQPIRIIVESLSSSDWEEAASPLQHYDNHRHAQTVPLVHDIELNHTNPARQPALQMFERVIRPVLAVTADYFDQSPKGKELTSKHGIGYFIRANFVRLLPGGRIVEQRDRHFSLIHAHRVHAPIVTNNVVASTAGAETLYIPEGEIYEVNNCRPHSVRNDSDVACVCLVLDYVLQGEKCCCGEKLRPNTPCSPDACRETDLGRTPCTCLPELP